MHWSQKFHWNGILGAKLPVFQDGCQNQRTMSAYSSFFVNTICCQKNRYTRSTKNTSSNSNVRTSRWTLLSSYPYPQIKLASTESTHTYKTTQCLTCTMYCACIRLVYAWRDLAKFIIWQKWNCSTDCTTYRKEWQRANPVNIVLLNVIYLILF